MSYIQRIEQWRASASYSSMYERLLGAIGTVDFGLTVRESIMSATAGARRIYLFEATGRIENDLQYLFCEPALVEYLPLYSNSYLQLDPIWDAYRATPGISDIAIQRIRPSDIASIGFRRRFFEEAGIVERVSVVQRGSDAWRAVSVVRHEANGVFSDDEITALINIAWLALPMLTLNRSGTRSSQQISVDQYEERFAMRFPNLTLRERQVCARAAKGMTVEATALDLRIAKSSVLTYRQRAYGRLNVTSPFQLCSLVSH